VVITWPGITGVVSFSYTYSVGISPSVAMLECYPTSTPDGFGNLTFGDGINPSITLAACLLTRLQESYELASRPFHVLIKDRRWRWQDRFHVSRFYNQVDGRRKLKPFMVRSPWQVVQELIGVLGEVPGYIDIPPGLASPAGAGIAAPGTGDVVLQPKDTYLRLGENYAQTATNPPTRWDCLPAAKALASFVEQFGRMVVWNYLTERIDIRQIGQGPAMPTFAYPSDGFVSVSPSLDVEAIPSAVIAVGAPARFQTRLRLRAMLYDWDGHPVPAENASFAPITPPAGQKMKVVVPDVSSKVVLNALTYTAGTATTIAAAINAESDVRVAGVVTASVSGVNLVVEAVTPGVEFELRVEPEITVAANQPRCEVGPVPAAVVQQHTVEVSYQTVFIPNDGLTYSVTIAGDVISVTSHDSIAETIAALAWEVNTNAFTAVGYRAGSDGRVLTVSKVTPGSTFTCTAASGHTGPVVVTVTRPGITQRTGWEKAPPSAASLARATSRLNYPEAMRLARGLYTTYQVVCEDPGPLSLSQQITKVDFSPVVFVGLNDDMTVTLDKYRVTIDGFYDEVNAGYEFRETIDRLANTLQRNLTFSARYTIEAVGLSIIITRLEPGVVFTVTASTTAAVGVPVVSSVQAATAGPKPTIPVPGFGIVTNRHQLILLSSRPEQIVPRPGDTNLIDQRTGQPFAAETYTGYSADKPNVAFGSIHQAIISQSGEYWRGGNYYGNTPPRTPIYIPFTIVDPEQQIIQFDRPLFRLLGLGNNTVVLPAELVVEVGANVLDSAGWAPVRYEYSYPIAGATAPPIRSIFGDVQYDLIPDYDAYHRAKGVQAVDKDAEVRAEAYARGLAATYQIPGALMTTYRGCVAPAPSGFIRQIEWTLSAETVTTTASGNTEFSRIVPPYPSRRRVENQLQDNGRALENILSDARIRGTINAAAGIIGGGIKPGR
jgi:hypothetical protein